ncbi:MAG: N-acetylmuramoyl-L-alanine amidase [Patescibacteria group bacterium]
MTRINRTSLAAMMKNQSKKIRVNSLIFLVLFAIILLSSTLFLILLYSNYQITGSVVDAITTEENDTQITNEASEVEQIGKTVCIDPGHGGTDYGATYKEVNESDINLTVALKLRDILENKGYEVYMTRTADTFLAKRQRAYDCNSVKGDILVSIHHNSYPDDKTVNYDTALYYKASDKALATSILNATSSELDVQSEGIAKFDNSELWLAEMPAVLSEAFFITNTTEYNLISKSNSSRLEEEAVSIANGIENYFDDPDQTQESVDANSLIIHRTDYDD